MPLTATGEGPVSAAVVWLRGFWEFYRGYTHTAIHAASAAALTVFGLLIFIDRLFVVLAIAAYICPPLILYTIGADIGNRSSSPEWATDRADSRSSSDTDADTDSDSDDGDSDSDSDDRDADSDGTDADSDGTDADSDGADADSDGTDADSDGTDADSDGTDADSDGADADGWDADADADG